MSNTPAVSGEWTINKSTLLTVLLCIGILLLALFAWHKWGQPMEDKKKAAKLADPTKANATTGGTNTDAASASPKS